MISEIVFFIPFPILRSDINGDALHSSIGLPPALNVTTAKVGKLEIMVCQFVCYNYLVMFVCSSSEMGEKCYGLSRPIN